MLHKKPVSSRTCAWNYFLDTDAKTNWDHSIQKYLNRKMEVIKSGTQGVSWMWSLVNDTGRSTSDSCIIWTSPWALINGVLVAYKNLTTSLAIFCPLIPPFSAAIVLWFSGLFRSEQAGSEQPKKQRELICANLSWVEMIREWSCKQLG